MVTECDVENLKYDSPIRNAGDCPFYILNYRYGQINYDEPISMMIEARLSGSCVVKSVVEAILNTGKFNGNPFCGEYSYYVEEFPGFNTPEYALHEDKDLSYSVISRLLTDTAHAKFGWDRHTWFTLCADEDMDHEEFLASSVDFIDEFPAVLDTFLADACDNKEEVIAEVVRTLEADIGVESVLEYIREYESELEYQESIRTDYD